MSEADTTGEREREQEEVLSFFERQEVLNRILSLAMRSPTPRQESPLVRRANWVSDKAGLTEEVLQPCGSTGVLAMMGQPNGLPTGQVLHLSVAQVLQCQTWNRKTCHCKLNNCVAFFVVRLPEGTPLNVVARAINDAFIAGTRTNVDSTHWGVPEEAKQGFIESLNAISEESKITVNPIQLEQFKGSTVFKELFSAFASMMDELNQEFHSTLGVRMALYIMQGNDTEGFGKPINFKDDDDTKNIMFLRMNSISMVMGNR